MERTEKYFLWDAERWEERAEEAVSASKATISPSLSNIEKWKIREQVKVAQGKAAYAFRQAEIRRALYERACRDHAPLIPLLNAVPVIVEYEAPAPAPVLRNNRK